MKIIITGATGFIGKNILNYFHKIEDVEIIALVRSTSDTSYLEGLGIDFKVVDLLNSDTFYKYIEDCDVFIHNAAVVRGCNWNTFIKSNILPTQNIVDALNKINPRLKRFIFMSSQAVAGPSLSKIVDEKDEPRPVNWYGMSKLICENYIRQNAEVPYTIIRPASVFGPFDTDFLTYFKMLKTGVFIFAPKFKIKMSIIYVEDLVRLIHDIIEKEIAVNEIYFAKSEDISLYDLGLMIKEAMQVRALKLEIPMFVLWIIAYFNIFSCIFKKKPAVISPAKVKELYYNWVCSNEKIKKELLFTPRYSLEQAIKRTFEWYMDHGFL